MPKPLTTIEMYAAVIINGKVVTRYDDKMMVGKLIIDIMKWANTHSVESRDTSTVQLTFTKQPVKSGNDPEDPFDAMIAALQADGLIGILTPDEELAAIEADRKMADPIYRTYMGLTTQTVGDYTGEELLRMREHMRKNYPELTLRY